MTRLGEFWKVFVTILLLKVIPKIINILGLFEKCQTVVATFRQVFFLPKIVLVFISTFIPNGYHKQRAFCFEGTGFAATHRSANTRFLRGFITNFLDIIELVCTSWALNHHNHRLALGCRHSLVDSSMPSILLPRVRVRSTPSMLSSIYWIL